MTGNKLNWEYALENGESVGRKRHCARLAGHAVGGNEPILNLRVAVVSYCIVMLISSYGCNRSETITVRKPTFQVAFDQKSKQAYLVDGGVALPTAHPQDSKIKLQPAMFCSKCDRWYPLPPVEQLNRNPGAAMCPKDRLPLTPDGPLPEKQLDLVTGEIR